MSRATHAAVKHDRPATYVQWRTELLAKLALSRLPGVDVFRPEVNREADYVVVAPDGVPFAVQVKGYSSIRLSLTDVARRPGLDWQVDRRLLDQARASRMPVVLFLFDADTDHGRYLRLDTLPAADGIGRTVTVHLPIANTISGDSLGRLLAQFRLVAHAG